jgi:hypothetical protein
MAFKATFLLFSIFFGLAIGSINVPRASSGVASFFWLKAGTQAFYTFSGGPMLFDDGANGNPFRGNYSWLCVNVNYTHAVLNVEVNLELFKKPEWTTPAYIVYVGTEFLEKAARGDLSFIKRIPMDQVAGEQIELSNMTAGDEFNGVYIPSPVFISKKFQVAINLDDMMMIDQDGKQWGKWVLWIDPLKYPLAGWDQRTMETFVTNWLNTTITVWIFYFKELEGPALSTPLGAVKRYFYATPDDFVENQFLTDNGWSGILPAYCYEPRTGVFLTTWGPYFLDDVLTQEFGVVGCKPVGGATAWMQLASIAFPGDLNSDWQVNISDITIVAVAFNSRPGEQRWNQKADVNKDGVINIVDITLVAKVFGTQYVIPE